MEVCLCGAFMRHTKLWTLSSFIGIQINVHQDGGRIARSLMVIRLRSLHILSSLLNLFYALGIEHEDVMVRLFLLSLEEKQRDWIRHSCKPKSISSSMVLIQEFLKYWGPRAQKFEDTIQDLEDAFLGQGLPLDPIEDLRETLLLEFVEKTIEEQKD
jgi:hypothetical protein